MTPVAFIYLSLSGFGPHRDTVEVTFNEGMNVLIAQNERGKSALVAGLASVIFGIPQVANVQSFGRGRFRNLNDPPRFAGEVRFIAGEAEYRIRRNFDSNQVSLARRQQNDRYNEVVIGEHNPGAHRRNSRYEEAIAAIFGIKSRELFEATFCITQPMPTADEIDGQVQGLLSGTGAGFMQSVSRLVDELKAITRNTKQRGVTSRDLKDPRPLENIAEEIQALQEKICSDTGTVDHFEQSRMELQKSEEDQRHAARELSDREAILQAWTVWQRLQDHYRIAMWKNRDRERAKIKAAEYCAKIRGIRETVQGDFGELATASQECGQTIEELAKLDARIADFEKQLSEIEEILTKLMSQKEKLDEGYSGSTGCIRRWEALGAGPSTTIRNMRRMAEQSISDWRAFINKRSDLKLIQSELDRYSPLGGLAPQESTQARMSRTTRERLEQNVTNARLMLENALIPKQKALIIWVMPVGLAVVIGLATWVGGLGLLPIVLLALAGGLVGLALARLFFVPKAIRKTEPVTELQRRLNEAYREYDAFVDMITPLEALFGDVETAFTEWDQALAKAGQLEQEILDYRQKELNTFAGDAEQCPLDEGISERWTELFAFAAAMDPSVPITLLGELTDWLTNRESSWWEGLIAESQHREEVSSELKTILGQLKAHCTQRDSLSTSLWELHTQQKALANKIASILSLYGDANTAFARWKECEKLKNEIEALTRTLEELLSGQEAKTIEDLENLYADSQMAAITTRSDWQKHIDTHPGLPAIDQAEDAININATYQRIRREVESLKITVAQKEEAVREKTRELARLEGQEPMNIAEANDRLASLEQRRRELELSADALTAAYTDLSESIMEFQASHRARLANTATCHFERLTGVTRRTVCIDDEFKISVDIDGQRMEISQLSQGARDQLYLAIRLSIGGLLADDVILPFVFDDPFLNCDRDRLERIRESLNTLTAERQVILLSHDEGFESWGNMVEVSGMSLR